MEPFNAVLTIIYGQLVSSLFFFSYAQSSIKQVRMERRHILEDDYGKTKSVFIIISLWNDFSSPSNAMVSFIEISSSFVSNDVKI